MKIDRAASAAALATRLSLYEQGLTDGEIASRTGAKKNTIVVWRRARDLPVNRGSRTSYRLTPTQRAARMLMYQLGWSDRHIAREQGVHKTSIRGWRRDLGLAANFSLGVNELHNPRPTLAGILDRVKKAIGRGLPRDIAEEATQAMIVDILDGTIPVAEIEKAARRYGNKALEQFANRYGPRSLNEELGDDGDGFTMMDMIPDERSSSWLEEMGATVW
ncbi:hypothetical protein NED98_13115 [Sphingomonas sp. MMSM20]|uniref:hypothetical protein n=1 Tax=Sphingomonas lycopersici TaxID=2951807 RepID=UPI002238281F|nr:hypothetical protein [Sphingomonas lycopersici]MCW6531186.1 hypothetical protein [Sphingomonas lycopersici]